VVTTSMPEALCTALPLPELTLGSYRPPDSDVRIEPTSAATRGATTDADLPAIEARCRLKAEGVRWAATRQRRMDEGAEIRVEIAPRDREILDRARDLECYLWMNTPDFPIPKEPSSLEEVAGCFGAVADAVALVRGEHESINKFEPYVARTEVSLVLLAIRWSSHSFGEVKGFCKE
jgi:hypothetical protein